MKWQVQFNDGKTQHCTLPAQISEGVPFTAELGGDKTEGAGKQAASERVARQGRQVRLLHDIGEGMCLEENLTLLAQELSPLVHGHCQVQVLYATRAGKVHSCRAQVGLAAAAMQAQQADSRQSSEVVSPLTGKVLKVLVAQGAQVQQGEALLIIEAMKMENIVQAEGSGTVAALNVKVGDAVRSGDVLLSLGR